MRTEVHPDAPPGAALLRSWLDNTGQSIPSFCEASGLDRVTVQRLLTAARGKRISLELATSIEDATGGVVPARSWLHPSDDSTAPTDEPVVVREGFDQTAEAP